MAGCLCALLVATGCGGGGDSGAHGNDDPSDSYLPLALGNSWEYVMKLHPDMEPIVVPQTEDFQQFIWRETVTAVESRPEWEVDYFLIHAYREATDDYRDYEEYQLRRSTEEEISARMLFVDDDEEFYYHDVTQLTLPPVEGDTWPDAALGATFTTAAVGEQITVPAGTFRCVRVEMSYDGPEEADPADAFVVKTWYARGVGIVRDETWEGDELTSMIELVEYEVQ